MPLVCKEKVQKEFHNSRFVVHPRSTKMFHDLSRQYKWRGIKNDVVEFVSRCYVCHRVKAEHKSPVGELQPLSIPQWKREHITLDFVCGLPQSRNDNYVVWVLVNRLMKNAHFIPMKMTDT